jgi:hypothetical protein
MIKETRKIIRKWKDGRVLLTTEHGDQYWLMNHAGIKEKLSLQQASVLLQSEQLQQENVEQDAERPEKTRSIAHRGPGTKQKRTRKPPPSDYLTKRDLEDAAAYFMLRDPDDQGKFLPVDQLRADELKHKVEEIRKKLDQDDSPQASRLCLAFFLGAARLWRQHLMVQNSGSETA